MQELLLAIETARSAGVAVVIRLYITQGGLQRRTSEIVLTLQDSSLEKSEKPVGDGEGFPKRRSFVSDTTDANVNDLFASPEVTTVHDGRPDISRTVKNFTTEGVGSSLVIGMLSNRSGPFAF